ncbi:hypothetical protein P3S67_032492 [Capsicum chacoense]
MVENDNSMIAKRVENVTLRIFNWKVVGIKVKYEKFMGDMFSRFVYNNLRPTHEEVQTLDLQMIKGFEINDVESGFSHETAAESSGKRPAIDIHSHSNLDIQGLEDFSTVPPTKILKKADLITDASASQLTKRQRVPAAKTTPSSSNKSVRSNNSDEKWDEIKVIFAILC